MIEALHEGAKNEAVFCTILTGVGNTYSCGTDFFDGLDIDIEERLIAVR